LNTGVALIKRKEAVNVDELLCVQFFNFTQTYTRQGKKCEDRIGFKIKGLKLKPVSLETTVIKVMD
jgi:hypothetical protein